MTPTNTEALAAEWQKKATAEASRRNSAYDHYGMDNTPENVDPLGAKMAAELRRLDHNNRVLTDALWKACGDDEATVNATIESQGELK